MKSIEVTIIYALKNKQYIKKITLKHEVSIEQAILDSNIIDTKIVDIRQNNVGIYGRIINLTDIVCHGDRIEIYRPLLIDPKSLRRKKALLKKKVDVNILAE